MKIAITADLHLTTRESHPERYHAFENILEQMIDDKIDTMIVAGDLFHETCRNAAELETICRNPKYKHVQFHFVPGNHDALLEASIFASENIFVHTEPQIHRFDLMSMPFVFLPYQKEKTMGEALAPLASEVEPHRWILVGHGDWVEGMREVNPMEPGVYMPLTRTDLESFRPARAILGHIHKSMDRGIVHYPGSPCPMDIGETGRRRFLIIDAETGMIQSRKVDSDILYFDESLLILPVEDEVVYLMSQIDSKQKAWALTKAEKSRTQLRIKVRGYTSDKKRLMETVKAGFEGFAYYKNSGPDLDEVSLSVNVERAEIAHRVMNEIDQLTWSTDENEPGKDQILLEALRAIYEE